MRIPWRMMALLSLLAAGCQSFPSLSKSEQETKFDSKQMSADCRRGRKGDAVSDGGSSEALCLKDGDSKICAPSPTKRTESGELPSGLADVNSLLSRARAETKQGKYDLAKVDYRQVLSIEPDHPAAHQGLGNIADLEQDFSGAQGHYQAALRRTPENPGLLCDLGYSYLLQGRLSECDEALRNALRIQPGHARGLNNFGLLAAARGDYDGAFRAFQQATGDEAARKRMAELFPQGRPIGQSTGTSDGRPSAPVTPVEYATSPEARNPIVRTGGAEIEISNDPTESPSTFAKETTLGTRANTFSAGANQGSVVAMNENSRVIDASATQYKQNEVPRWPPVSHSAQPDSLPQWPPQSSAVDVMPTAYERGTDRYNVDSQGVRTGSAIDPGIAARYRAAAVAGLNAGPGGPFPVFGDSTSLSAGDPNIVADPRSRLPVTSPGESSFVGFPAQQGERATVGHRAERPNVVRTVAENPSEDPLAAYEVEIRRRSQSPYSLERSFRTGAGSGYREAAASNGSYELNR